MELTTITTMWAIIDAILDFLDKVWKLIKGGLKFPKLPNDATMFTVVSMVIMSLVALVKTLITGLKEKVEWEEKMIKPSVSGKGVRSEKEGEIVKVASDSVVVKSGDTYYKYDKINPTVKEGDRIVKGQSLGESTSDTYTVQRGKETYYDTSVSSVVGTYTGTMTDKQFKELQRKYQVDYSKEQGTDNKKYKEGLPSKGLIGRSAHYDEDIIVAMETLMTMCTFNEIQAAGIVGCLMAESSLYPLAFNRIGGSYGAQGIAQWRGARVEEYIKQYSVMPCLDPSLIHQLSFVAWELNNTYKKAKPAENATLTEATSIGFYKYEGAGGDPSAKLEVRVNNAMYAYNLYVKEHAKILSKHTSTNLSKTESGYTKQ